MVKLLPLLLHLLLRRVPLLLLLRRRNLRLRRRVPSGSCGLRRRRRRGVGDGGQIGQVRVQPRLVGRRGVEPARAVGLGDGADEAVVVLEELEGESGGGVQRREGE